MRVAAALVLGYFRIDDIVRASGVPASAVHAAIARLVAGGFVVEDGPTGYRFAIEQLKVTARGAAEARPDREDIDAPADAGGVLLAFLRDGRPTTIPVVHFKRLVVSWTTCRGPLSRAGGTRRRRLTRSLAASMKPWSRSAGTWSKTDL